MGRGLAVTAKQGGFLFPADLSFTRQVALITEGVRIRLLPVLEGIQASVHFGPSSHSSPNPVVFF